MKRLLIFYLFLLLEYPVLAGNAIYVTPFTTTAGLDEGTFSIELSNDVSIMGVQLDIYLPNGMEIIDDDGYVVDRGSRPNRKFTCEANYFKEGFYRIMLYTTGTALQAGTGEIIKVTYLTNTSITDGIYPILIKGVKISDESNEKIDIPSETSSYVVIGNSNPLSNDAHVDLSGMTGYVPSFVVEQLNTDIASNTKLRSLNLSGTTFANLGAELSVPNNDNLLWYTSDKASLNRTFKGEQWNTVCLPFTLQTSYLNASTVVKEMADYDGEATITLGDVTTMETGKPYLIYSSTDGQLIKDVTISNPVAVSNEPSTTSSNSLTMRGTYQEATVKSDGGYTRYGFTNGKFVMLGTGAATVPPFRAYLEYLGKSSTRSIGFAGDGTTSINSTVSEDESDGPLYDLKGVMVNENQQTKGIYVRNGKKLILK